MSLNIGATTSTDPIPVEAEATGVDAPDLQLFVFALFFVFGGITSLNDVIIPKLKELFTLSYAEAMLVQSAFFAAYFLISLPAAAIVKRIGYMRSAAVGLTTMATGCLLFVPAAASGIFAMFLGALFVLASGITVIQVVANPLLSMLGKPSTTHSRLTIGHAFNSLGTTIFPYVGSMLILGSLAQINISQLAGAELEQYRVAESQVIVRAYLGLAAALLTGAALVWWRRNRLVETRVEDTTVHHPFSLLRQPRFCYGALCIFLYVGAEVAIGSIIVNYLMQANVLGLVQETAGKLVAVYWGGAMVGRFIGSYFLRVFSPGLVLAFVTSMAIVLLTLSGTSSGVLSGWSLLAIGLSNSIMFPTIFALASEGLGRRAAEGSGIICVAIVGGAVVPLITGYTADLVGLKMALAVPALCYAGILGFGIYARRPLEVSFNKRFITG